MIKKKQTPPSDNCPNVFFLPLLNRFLTMFFSCSNNQLNTECAVEEAFTSKLYKTSDCHIHMEYVFGTLSSFQNGCGVGDHFSSLIMCVPESFYNGAEKLALNVCPVNF